MLVEKFESGYYPKRQFDTDPLWLQGVVLSMETKVQA